MKKFITFLILLLPSAVFAASSSSAEHHLDWAGLGWRILVFVIFVVLMFKILRKPLLGALSKRTEDIEKALGAAEKAKQEALVQVRDYQDKLKALELELAEMKENALRAAEKERDMIISDAQKSVEKMKQFAINMIESEVAQAKYDIKHEVVLEIFKEAQKQISSELQGAKQKAVLEDYIKRIGE